jgi:murein DD-endopeptidase MepM/ murein hydrolase activator NlpD
VRLLALLCAAALALLTPAAGAGEGAALTASPGTLVRWAGAGTDRCGMDGEVWAALGDTCWYPIDLLRPPGKAEVARWLQGRRQTATLEVRGYPYEVEEIHLDDDSKVHLSAADLARNEREQAAVAALWSRRGPARFTLPLAPPLVPLPAGGRFGARRIFNGEPRSPHTGIDFPAPAGTPVLAVADGRVVLAANHFFSGNSVFIDHGGGLISMYFHLSAIAVKEGEEVRRGERLGAVGATGRVTGPHLHFGLRWHGARIDPQLLLGPPAAVPALPSS